MSDLHAYRATSQGWLTFRGTGVHGPGLVPNILLDTDFASDVDDMGAVAVLHAFADLGECNVAGTVVSSKCPTSPAALEATNIWHGRPDLPVGSFKGASESASIDGCSDVSSNWTKAIYDDQAAYPRTLGLSASVQDAVTLYRQLLAGAADNSVTIVTIGFLTNLSALLDSPGDGIDSRTGSQLVAAKVVEAFVMGGREGATTEFNLDRAPVASKNVIDNLPVQITFNPWDIGAAVTTATTNFDLTGHIVRFAYDTFDSVHWTNTFDGHYSWDLVTVLQAVRGNGPWFTTERGTVTFDVSTEKETFTADPEGPHLWTSLVAGQAAALETLLEPLLWTRGGGEPEDPPPSGTVTFYIQVRDTVGAALAGASVTAVGMGETYQATTGTFGWANLTVLEGSYDITAAKSGFVAQTMLGVVRDVNNFGDLTFDLAADSEPDPDEPVAPGQPSVLTQPSQPYGSSWLPQDVSFPTVAYAQGAAKWSDTSIWGIYAWINEYKGLRSQINDVGWKTVRISGPDFDDQLMTMIAQDGRKLLRNLNPSIRRQSYASDQAFIDALKNDVTVELNRWGPGGTFWAQNPSVPYRPMDTFIIVNEPNFGYMWGSPATAAQKVALYVKLLPQLHDHIRQWTGTRTIAYNAGDASRAGNAWFRDVSAGLAANGHLGKFDAANHQPYTGTVAPDLKYDQFSGWSHLRNVNDYRQHIQNNGRNAQQVPWLWTEGGWRIDPSLGGTFDSPGMTNELLWAAHYMRKYLVGLRCGLMCVTPMYITDSDGFNGGFFNTIAAKTYRQSAHGMKVLIGFMPNPVLHSAPSDGPGVHVHRYHRNGPGSQVVAVAWNPLGPSTATVPVNSSNVIVTDMLGNKGSVTASGSTVSLNVGPLPIYVES